MRERKKQNIKAPLNRNVTLSRQQASFSRRAASGDAPSQKPALSRIKKSCQSRKPAATKAPIGKPSLAAASKSNPNQPTTSQEHQVAVRAGDVQKNIDSVMLVRAGLVLLGMLAEGIDIGKEGELVLDWIVENYDEDALELIMRNVSEEWLNRDPRGGESEGNNAL